MRVGFCFAILAAAVASGCSGGAQHDISGPGALVGATADGSGSVAPLQRMAASAELPGLDTISFLDVNNVWPTGPAAGRTCAIDGLYTRLVVSAALESASAGAARRDYMRENRSALERLVAGRDQSITLSAKITVGENELLQEIPLFAMSHESNMNVGERWFTSLLDSDFATPFFLVRPTSDLKIAFVYNSSREVNSNAVQVAVEAARSILNVAAPGSNLLTEVSRQSFRDQAQAIDSTLSGLFQKSLGEQIVVSGSLPDYSASAQYGVRLYYPDAGNELEPRYTVGAWTVSPSPPRPSIFSPATVTFNPADCTSDRTRIEAALLDRLSAQDILGFKLSKDTTLRSRILEKAEMERRISLLATATATATAPATSPVAELGKDLCETVRQSLRELGLNAFDRSIALRSMLASLALPSDRLTAIGSACGVSTTLPADTVETTAATG